MHVDLVLKAETPAFLGSDQTDRIEARSAPIRGVLRYWLRALLGGAFGDTNLIGLKQLEESVFGSTRGCSPVSVRVTRGPDAVPVVRSLLPHKAGNAGGRPALDGAHFTIRLSARPLQPQAAFDMAVWAAVIWLSVGGLGCRSRRGAGSLRLQSADLDGAAGLAPNLCDALGQLASAAATPLDLLSTIRGLIGKAHGAAKAYALQAGLTIGVVRAQPGFPVLGPATSICVWSPPATSNYEALGVLMSKMSSTKAKLDEPAFGNSFGRISPRFASPLHVTLHPTGAGPALVLTYLGGVNANVTAFLGSLAAANPGGVP